MAGVEPLNKGRPYFCICDIGKQIFESDGHNCRFHDEWFEYVSYYWQNRCNVSNGYLVLKARDITTHYNVLFNNDGLCEEDVVLVQKMLLAYEEGFYKQFVLPC